MNFTNKSENSTKMSENQNSSIIECETLSFSTICQ